MRFLDLCEKEVVNVSDSDVSAMSETWNLTRNAVILRHLSYRDRANISAVFAEIVNFVFHGLKLFELDPI